RSCGQAAGRRGRQDHHDGIRSRRGRGRGQERAPEGASSGARRGPAGGARYRGDEDRQEEKAPGRIVVGLAEEPPARGTQPLEHDLENACPRTLSRAENGFSEKITLHYARAPIDLI